MFVAGRPSAEASQLWWNPCDLMRNVFYDQALTWVPWKVVLSVVYGGCAPGRSFQTEQVNSSKYFGRRSAADILGTCSAPIFLQQTCKSKLDRADFTPLRQSVGLRWLCAIGCADTSRRRKVADPTRDCAGWPRRKLNAEQGTGDRQGCSLLLSQHSDYTRDRHRSSPCTALRIPRVSGK